MDPPWCTQIITFFALLSSQYVLNLVLNIWQVIIVVDLNQQMYYNRGLTH